MFTTFVNTLRANVGLFNTAFIGFTGAAITGYMTVDANSSTPEIWLAAMWTMLGIGLILVVVGVFSAISAALTGKG